jgi:hypothetical protein
MDFGADSSGMRVIKAGLGAKLNYANVGALRGDQGKWIEEQRAGIDTESHLRDDGQKPKYVAKDVADRIRNFRNLNHAAKELGQGYDPLPPRRKISRVPANERPPLALNRSLEMSAFAPLMGVERTSCRRAEIDAIDPNRTCCDVPFASSPGNRRTRNQLPKRRCENRMRPPRHWMILSHLHNRLCTCHGAKRSLSDFGLA